MALRFPDVLNQTGLTSNGNSNEVSFGGGSCSIAVVGTFDGATVKLQASINNGATYFDVPSGSFTSSSIKNIEISQCFLRYNVSSAGASTDVDVLIRPFLYS